MINKWMYVRYVDDGVCEFRCLKCKESWRADGAPGYTHEGAYHRCWNFCPLCGTEWEGSQRENADEVGPRRRRIDEAVETRLYSERYKPRPTWILEKKFNYEELTFKSDWEKVYETHSTITQAWPHLKDLMSRIRAEEESDKVWGIGHVEFRFTRGSR